MYRARDFLWISMDKQHHRRRACRPIAGRCASPVTENARVENPGVDLAAGCVVCRADITMVMRIFRIDYCSDIK